MNLYRVHAGNGEIETGTLDFYFKQEFPRRHGYEPTEKLRCLEKLKKTDWIYMRTENGALQVQKILAFH